MVGNQEDGLYNVHCCTTTTRKCKLEKKIKRQTVKQKEEKDKAGQRLPRILITRFQKAEQLSRWTVSLTVVLFYQKYLNTDKNDSGQIWEIIMKLVVVEFSCILKPETNIAREIIQKCCSTHSFHLHQKTQILGVREKAIQKLSFLLA